MNITKAVIFPYGRKQCDKQCDKVGPFLIKTSKNTQFCARSLILQIWNSTNFYTTAQRVRVYLGWKRLPYTLQQRKHKKSTTLIYAKYELVSTENLVNRDLAGT